MATIDSSLVLGQQVSNDGFAFAVADYCRRVAQQARDARGSSPEWFVGTQLEREIALFEKSIQGLA
jgi:hypothetical protein